MYKRQVLEGDLSKLYEDGGRYVAAVYSDDDYGNPEMDSHWARLGDIVTVRYVEETEYVDPDTGIAYASPEDVPASANYVAQPVKYRDVEYEVAALVAVPISLSYRYYGADEFILNDQTFMQDSGTDSVMYYAFDTTDEAKDVYKRQGLAHEQYVTSLIHAIYEAAYEARDFRTMQFLDWFVKEQGEEETNATDLIKKMELFGSDPKGLYMLDQELAARTYAAPSLTL